MKTSSPTDAGATAPTWEEFCAGYDRCFDRVYAYTSRRVKDTRSCERIVSEVLEANVELLVDRGDPRKVFLELKAALDGRIGRTGARDAPAGATEA